MKDLFKSKFLETLGGKLTAILSFAVILVVVLAVLGSRIEDRWLPLIYVVAIAAMGIFTYQIFARNRSKTNVAQQPVPSPTLSPSSESVTTKQKRQVVDSLNARSRYLNAVIADSRAMRLVGLDPQAADPSRGGLTLESLYVSLNTTTFVDNGEEIADSTKSDQLEANGIIDRNFEQSGHPLGALEALSEADNRRMVLLGLPGTGKSTFVRYLTLRMAQAETDKSKSIQDWLPGWKGGAILPLILSLGRMAETISMDCKRGSAVLIENYIKQTLKNDERTSDFAEHILVELEHIGGLVLFDGLDEVADLQLRPIVVQAVEDFVQKYGRRSVSRFLVTCRTYSYYHDAKWQLTGWSTHELALLDNEKIKYFINAWHGEHSRIEPARKPDLERKRTQLLASLQPDDRRRLHEIAPFPIILTMMAVVHTHYGELPDTRAEVYERCVDLLLVRWEIERPVSGQSQGTHKRTIVDELGISQIVLNRALWEIAFKAHEGREDDGEKKRGPALVTEDLLAGILQTQFQDLGKVKVFLDYCQSSNGLLMLQGSIIPADAPPDTPPRRVYAFPHLTFEEYLAARYLIRPNLGKITSELVQKSDRWREVVMLLGEHLCFVQGDQERMDTLLSALTPEKLPVKMDDPLWRSIWYAGDLLSLYRRAFPSETSRSEKEINTGLHELVFEGALSLRERASTADTLSELGWVPNDLYEFVEFEEQEGLLHYWMAKYPVTNIQYERFLDSGLFAEERYWIDLPKFAELQKNCALMKDTWGGEGLSWLHKHQQNRQFSPNGTVVLPRYWNDARFGHTHPTTPVVGITWWEANAYCRWLDENWITQQESRNQFKPQLVRLSTEKEWILAAGGERNNRYPWDEGKNTVDESEILRRANTTESRIAHTTPVYMYPLGRTARGICDMAGNVWEWQANFRDKEHEGLAMRGGSWFDDLGGACVAVGRNRAPDHYWLFAGFRVIAIPK